MVVEAVVHLELDLTLLIQSQPSTNDPATKKTLGDTLGSDVVIRFFGVASGS
jgi:hypothetical protein